MTEASSWVSTSVESCLVPISLKNKTKIQTGGYKVAGRYPIIDQGQDQIAGWTDDEAAVITAPLPIVVFGDHSRTFKFVDFPFARGADGTQLLRPKPEIDPLYFFYACRSIDLPARGYNRHFSILKEKEIVFPADIDVQRAIGHSLNKIEALIRDQERLCATLFRLKKTTTKLLFTQGLQGGAQKETEVGLVPTNWQVQRLGAVSSLSTGTTPATKNEAYYQGEIPFIRTSEITNNRISSAVEFISQRAVDDYGLKLFPPGTILMAMYGQGKTRGQTSLLEISAATTQNAAAIQPSPDLDPTYLWHYLLSCYERLRSSGSLGHLSHLNLSYLREFLIVYPPLPEQHEIVAILDAVDRKINLHRQKHLLLEELFTFLLHKLMAGEMNVKDLDLSVLSKETAVREEVVP